ncbi:MAG: glycosyltransferase family 9 protein [Flavobacteriaceae bacterium]|nr:glycosyltransferase family 9 protein [Flavobacteriaceae bacterium]
MGDVAMTLPVIRVVAQTYPHLKLTICSKPFFKPLFQDIPNCSFLESDLYGEHKNLGLQKLADEALDHGIDAVADLHNVLRTKAITSYLWLKGIPIARIDKGRSEKRALTNAKGRSIAPLRSTHQRYADVFEKLGFPIDLDQHLFPLQRKLLPVHYELISKQPKKIIGIAPFAAYPSKMYPLDQMEAVIATLNERNKYQLFLFGGGEDEKSLFESWESKYNSVSSIAGKLTFEQELALISNIDAMVAMDSGNGHLAAAFGIPVLTLWGVTHPYAGFTPFQQPNAHQLISNRDQYPLIPTSVYGNKYPPSYENAMKSIPTELVINKIEELVK